MTATNTLAYSLLPLKGFIVLGLGKRGKIRRSSICVFAMQAKLKDVIYFTQSLLFPLEIALAIR
jgi:hypothetical protein